MNYSINVEKCYEPDVLVCGMGPAGLIAAIAAARTGAKVMGIEKCGYSGGNITNGIVNGCCGIADQLTGELVVGGITLEICAKTDTVELPLKDNKLFTPIEPHKHQSSSESVPARFDVELFKYIADRMILENNIDIFYHTRIFDVVSSSGHIDYVMLANKERVTAVKPKIVVDCTGDGDVAAWAGAPFELDDPYPGTMLAVFDNLDTDLRNVQDRLSIRANMLKVMEKAYEDGLISLWTMPGIALLYHGVRNVGIVHGTKIPVVSTDAKSLTAAEIKAREQVRQFMKLYKDGAPEFKDAHLILTGPNFGLRESRRIIGEYILTAEDIRNTRHFDDSIAKGAWPIDVVFDKPGLQVSRPGKDFVKPYGIPYRTLLPQKVDNLLVAGRCHSATHEALGSTRVALTAMVMGEAAGTAATMAADASVAPKKVDISKLRELLISNGGII